MKRPSNLSVVICSLGAAWLAGCASVPPEPVAELSEASALVQQADAAGASQFAPGPLASAHSSLDAARELSDDGKHERARMTALRASADAKFALAATERGKAEKAVTQSDAALAALRAEAQRN